MSNISLVDINQLTQTASKDVGILIPVDLPTGGSSYAIRYITKEDFLKLSGQAIDYAVNGSTDIITTSTNGGGSKITVYGDGSDTYIILEFAFLQINDGTDQFNITPNRLKTKVAQATISNGTSNTDAPEVGFSYLYLSADGGSIAAGDIRTPQNVEDGWTFQVKVVGTITALTMTSGAQGASFVGAPTTATDQTFKFVYDRASDTWYHMS